MSKPEIILSNATNFFIGGTKATFAAAAKHGFRSIELIPYQWTNVNEIIALQKQTSIQVAVIHLTMWWNDSFWQAFKKQPGILAKAFSFIWEFYLGATKSSPGWTLAQKLEFSKPSVLLHTNVVEEMGWDEFARLSQKFHLVVENIPYEKGYSDFLWNPIAIEKEFLKRSLSAGLVFDPGHFLQSQKHMPELNLLDTYRQIHPEEIHISYNSGNVHALPNAKEQEDLIQMLRIFSPRYLTLETYPWFSIPKGKALLEKIIAQAFKA